MDVHGIEKLSKQPLNIIILAINMKWLEENGNECPCPICTSTTVRYHTVLNRSLYRYLPVDTVLVSLPFHMRICIIELLEARELFILDFVNAYL